MNNRTHHNPLFDIIAIIFYTTNIFLMRFFLFQFGTYMVRFNTCTQFCTHISSHQTYKGSQYLPFLLSVPLTLYRCISRSTGNTHIYCCRSNRMRATPFLGEYFLCYINIFETVEPHTERESERENCYSINESLWKRHEYSYSLCTHLRGYHSHSRLTVFVALGFLFTNSIVFKRVNREDRIIW